MTAPPTIRIFTFKEGLLSRFGHDLRFSLEKFELKLHDGRLTGRFWTESITLDGVMRDGHVDRNVLSATDQKKILQIAAYDLLKVEHFPAAEFDASVDETRLGIELRGTLTLVGQRRALPLVRPDALDRRVLASTTISPSRWGIRPYRAMAGALRIKDRVDIEISVPAELDAKTSATWACGE